MIKIRHKTSGEVLLEVAADTLENQKLAGSQLGGAKLAGREKMIAALQRLGGVKEASRLPASLNAFGINGGHGALARLLMSHPPLAERIQALREGT
mgnify:CR=1 FL=1